MLTQELNGIIIETQKIVEEAFEFLHGKPDLIDRIPSVMETPRLYENFKQAMQIEKEKKICIEKLKYIIKSISDIMPKYCLEEYGYDFKSYNDAMFFLKRKPFYDREEQQKAFQSQFMEACTEEFPQLCLRNGQTLKFFNGSEKVFQIEDDLEDFLDQSMGIYCITVNSTNFEEEYQKYRYHLLQHGHEYTGENELYPWNCIAETLAHLFGGQVEFWGFPFSSFNFHYPYDFDNKKYIEYIKKIVEMRKNKDFMRAYKIYCCVKNMNDKLGDLVSHYEKLCNECFNSINMVCPQNIVFLQRLYNYIESCNGYEEIDYYKVLDIDAYRDICDDNHIGAWKYVKVKYLSIVSKYYSNPRRNLVRACFEDGSMLGCDYRFKDKSSELLYNEMKLVKVCDTEKEINNCIKNKIIIVSNENLNYTALLEEYYAHIGMNALEFSQMIREKYNCEVITPEMNPERTKLMVYSNHK